MSFIDPKVFSKYLKNIIDTELVPKLDGIDLTLTDINEKITDLKYYQDILRDELQVELRDENGNVIQVVEGTPLLKINEIQTFDINDGNIQGYAVMNWEGGKAPYTISLTDSQGNLILDNVSTSLNTFNFLNLNADTYSVTLKDDEDFQSKGEDFVIYGPIENIQVTSNDAFINVNFDGGKGPYTISLSVNGTVTSSIENLLISQYTFSSMTNGSYDVRITDDIGNDKVISFEMTTSPLQAPLLTAVFDENTIEFASNAWEIMDDGSIKRNVSVSNGRVFNSGYTSSIRYLPYSVDETMSFMMTISFNLESFDSTNQGMTIEFGKNAFYMSLHHRSNYIKFGKYGSGPDGANETLKLDELSSYDRETIQNAFTIADDFTSVSGQNVVFTYTHSPDSIKLYINGRKFYDGVPYSSYFTYLSYYEFKINFVRTNNNPNDSITLHDYKVYDGILSDEDILTLSQ